MIIKPYSRLGNSWPRRIGIDNTMGYVRFGQVGKCMERQLIMGAIVASLKTRPVEDANADEKFIKTERNQRNRASLYFRPSIILGFDGPNVSSSLVFLNVD